MGEDLADRVALEDRGEQLAGPAAVVADEYVQAKHALEELGPGGWVDKLGRDETLLYFFLTAAADKDGISYYSDLRIRGTLDIDQAALDRARARLQDLELVAYDPPLYQVLALDVPPERTGDTVSIKDVFRQIAQRDRGQ